MNRTQIGQIYDSFPESQQNIPRDQFIKRAMNTMNPVRCQKILDIMVDKKRQITQGRSEQARIDAVLKERR